MDDLLQDTARRAARFRAALDGRPVTASAEAVAALDILRTPLPDRPGDDRDVIALLDEVGSPATVATAGGRFFGFVVGSSLPVTVAASWLATAWDQEAGATVTSPIGGALEEVSAGWLLDLLRLPSESATAFVTGATMANLTALAAARSALLARSGWDVERQGMFGAPPITVVLGAEVHSSIRKALGILGFGRDRVVTVATDSEGRMHADEIPEISGPTIVCTQVGNVNTGSSDPVGAISDRVRPGGAWVHVDGAFGLWAAAAPQRAHIVDRVGEADSWATDAHKWLNVPYDSGIAFVRDGDALRAAMGVSAAYLTVSESRQPDQYTPEMSRRARGVEIWAALMALGREGVAELVERCCQHAASFADGLRGSGYEVLNDVELNQVLVSFGTDLETRSVIEAIQRDGTCWCGGTTWRGRAAMRISVSSWATTEEDVAASLAAILRSADAVRESGASGPPGNGRG